MSAFLGPIHHWLFNKISLHEKLEAALIDAYKNKYGNEIDKIVDNSIKLYGEPLGIKPLEDQIDLANIHQWLQNTIGRTETRLAYILAEVFRKHDEEAVDIALIQYQAQGNLCGKDAKEKGMANNAPNMYKALNDYILEGMPCDRANIVVENKEDKIIWNTTDCLHRNYWKEAGADLSTLYRLRFSWFKAFVSSANPEFEYFNRPGDNIDSLFIHEIMKKSSK